MARRQIMAAMLAAALGVLPVSGTEEKMPTVGLVLSGGGAKGIAHVGVIKALEDNDIPVSYTHLTLPTIEP